MKKTSIPATDATELNFLPALKIAIKELSAIRRANRATDAEIRRLQTSTRKKLGRIQENLRHVEAAR